MTTKTNQKTSDQTHVVMTALRAAITAARRAADRQLAELVAAGPRYVVVSGSGKAARPIDTMLDVCGGAWLTVSGKTRTHRLFKAAIGQAAVARDFTGGIRGVDDREVVIEGCRVFYRPGWPAGYSLSLFDVTYRQEMSVHIAAMEAARDRLAEWGFEFHVHSYID